MSKKHLLMITTLLLVSLVLVVCGLTTPAPALAQEGTPTAEATEEAMAETGEAVMLELFHDKPNWAANSDIMGEAAAEAIKVGFTTVPNEDPTTFQATIRASLSGDQAPDLYTWWSGYRMEDIVKAGGAADLTDIWQKYIDSGEYSQGLANAFTFDGKVYGAPFAANMWVVYYNKPLFEKYDLKPPTTWAEFETLNQTLLDKGITPMAQTFVDRWQSFIIFEEMILRTQGPEFYQKLMKGEAKYTDPEVVEAMELWQELMDKGYLSNDYAFGTATDTFLPAFQAGQVAMLPIGDWYSATLVGGGMEPGVDYDAFIMPNQNPDLPPALFFEAGPLLVGENSPNKEEAKQVIDWWMSVDAQNQWSKMMGFTPANSKADNPNVVGENVQKWVNDNQAQLVLRYWEATPPDIVDAAVDEFARFMLNPDQYMDVLTTIQQKADQVWAERGTPTEEAMAETGEAVMLELFHDKPNWAANSDIMGEAAAEAIKVGFTTVPNEDPTTFQATIRASLSGDQAPDLYTWWSGYRMEDIVKAGGAADLTDIWQKYIDSGEYSQGLANAFTFDGKVYGAPFAANMWVVYYNKPLFEKYDLKPPTTWAEFETLNQTLLDKGITPMAQTFVDRWQSFIIFEEMILRTQGPEFYQKLMKGEAKYTDPEVVEAMELWQELMDKGYLSNDYAFGTATDTFLPAFQAGQVAMLPIGDWYSATLVGGGMEPGVDYDAFIMPNQNPDLPPALFFEAGPLLVGENSPNKEEAKQVIDWWMSVDAQNQWNKMMGFTPANSKADNPNVVGENVQKWVNDNQAQLVLRYWEATPPDIVDAAVDEFARFMLNPDQYMDVLTTIQQKADQVWAERK